MKAFIICKEPFPNGMAATQRIQCYAKAIISQGIECEVLVFSRNEKGPVRKNMEARGVFEGIPFRYTGNSTRKPGHKLSRLASDHFDRWMLRRYLGKKLQNGDVVIGYVNSDIDFMSGIIELVHRNGAKFVRELCEIPYFGSQKKEDVDGLEMVLNRVFPNCDGFISIADTLSALAQEHKRADAAIIKIPVLVDYEKSAQFVQSYSSPTPYIFHAGTLYEQKDGIIGMLAAFGKAGASLHFPVKMIIAGVLEESPDKDDIIKTVQDFGLQDNVDFVGYCSAETVREYLAGSAFAVVNKHDNIQNSFGFSTKLTNYLAAGKAIIMTDVGEAMNWFENGITAWIVPHDDIDALSEAIVHAFNNPESCKTIGEKGRKLCQECFDWHSVSNTLGKFLIEIGRN